jgi:hypothetical protein
MATTTNYAWETPDDTDLVKDGASAIRTLGSSVDTSLKALSPGTTAGDIDYYTSATAKARLAKGTDGQFLSLASGVPAWATVSAGGSSFTLLNTGGTSLTGSSVTVSGLSGYEKYMVFLSGASSSSGSISFYLRINGDTGGNYSWLGGNITGAATLTYSEMNRGGGFGDDKFSLGTMSNQSGSIVSATCFITGGKSTGAKSAQITTGASMSSGPSGTVSWHQGLYMATAAISSMSITCSSGTFDAGTVHIYGSA